MTDKRLNLNKKDIENGFSKRKSIINIKGYKPAKSMLPVIDGTPFLKVKMKIKELSKSVEGRKYLKGIKDNRKNKINDKSSNII